MSDMKCPLCGQELKHEKTTGIYCCPTIFIDCPLGSGTGAFGTKELWQELIRTRKALKTAVKSIKLDKEFAEYMRTELGRTRKALDVAVDALKYANKCIKGGGVNWETEIDKALEQITALEQKDK